MSRQPQTQPITRKCVECWRFANTSDRLLIPGTVICLACAREKRLLPEEKIAQIRANVHPIPDEPPPTDEMLAILAAIAFFEANEKRFSWEAILKHAGVPLTRITDFRSRGCYADSMVVREYKAAKERHAEKTRRSHVSKQRHASVMAAIARLEVKGQRFTRLDVYREAGISTRSNDLGTIESLKDAYDGVIGRLEGKSL